MQDLTPENTASALAIIEEEVNYIADEIANLDVDKLSVAVMCRIDCYLDKELSFFQDAIDYAVYYVLIDYDEFLQDVVNKRSCVAC